MVSGVNVVLIMSYHVIYSKYHGW